MGSQGKKSGTKLSETFICLLSNELYIFVVKFISESAGNEVSIESEANLDDWIIHDTLALQGIIKIYDNFACKLNDLVQWMEFSDLINLISEDFDIVLKIYL